MKNEESRLSCMVVVTQILHSSFLILHLTKQLCQHQVGKQDEHAAAHHGVGRRLAHGDAAALYGVAEESRHAGDDEGEDDGLDDAHPHVPLDEHVLQAIFQVDGVHHLSEPTGAEGTDDACKDAEDDQDRYHRNHGCYFGQYQVVGRVDSHDFQRVDLLGDAHGAQLGGDVRPHLARQDEAHDGGRKLQQHDFAGHIAHRPARHPGTFDVQFDLYGDDCADKKRYQQDNANGVYPQFGQFCAVLPEEHVHPFGARKRASH